MCLLLFRKDRSLPDSKNTGGDHEAEKLQAGDGRDVSVEMDSERDIDVTTAQLQDEDCTDNSQREVTNTTVSAACSAPQYVDKQHNSGATESSYADGNCVGVVSQHTNSTDVNDRKSCEQPLTQFSNALSIAEAGVDCCRKSSSISCTESSSKSAPVSAELRVSTSSSSAVKQSSVRLHPKPTFTLLPVRVEVPLLVIVNTSGSQTNDRRVRLPTIAPRPADDVSGNPPIPAVSQGESSVVGHCDGLPCDLSVPKSQRKAVASVVTQTSSRARCKTAATQTSAPVSRLSKESRASQVTLILLIVMLLAFQKQQKFAIKEASCLVRFLMCIS